MSPVTLCLDTRLRIAWQHPTALQVGIDPPRVVISNLDDRMLALLHGLSVGMTRSGIDMLAKENSLSEQEIKEFLLQLAPALLHTPDTEKTAFTLDCPRADASALRAVWEALGHEVSVADGSSYSPRGEVIIIADFVLDPNQHHSWLRLDRVHTPIVFTDQSVIVGPRVEPGVSACLHCLRMGALDDNPYETAISSQLWGQRAPAHTPALAALAAWHCYELIHTGAPSEIRRIDSLNREVTFSVALPHPQCDCRGFA